MRYLKRQSTNKRLLNGKGLIYTQYETIEAQSTGAFLVPKGTQVQRPVTPIEGQLRFNTTLRQLEVYESLGGGAPVWKQFRLSEPQNIVVQNLSNGDDTEVNFGNLDDGFGSGLGYPTASENVLVMVENVLQIPNTNYTLTQNPCDVNSNTISAVANYSATGVGAFVSSNPALIDWQSKGYHVGQTVVVTGSATNNGTFTVTAVTPSHLSVNTLLNTEANSVGGNTFGMDGKSSVTGLSYPTGQYITFGTAVPTGKPVTVLHNFDK
jgi:hypothetical protein|tara:strand:- start:675 stop:1472 length:798 start_codon:yes stop_codon:yes gene_type:complete